MPYRRQAETLLADWREAERLLGEVEPDSTTAETLRGEILRMRDEYQALIEAARAAQAPEPPQLPADAGSG